MADDGNRRDRLAGAVIDFVRGVREDRRSSHSTAKVRRAGIREVAEHVGRAWEIDPGEVIREAGEMLADRSGRARRP